MPFTLAIESVGSQTRAALLDSTKEPASQSPDESFSAIAGVAWDEKDIGPGALNPRRIIEKALEATEKVVQKAGIKLQEIEGAAIAVVSAIDSQSRMIPPNEKIGSVMSVELGKPLRAEFRKVAPHLDRIILQNRSQFGAWADANYGAARSRRLKQPNLIYITISYYIDAGIIIDGKLYQGSHGIAGQYSHMIVEPESQITCTLCGLKGCLWTMGSGLAMLRGVKDAIEHGNFAAIDSVENSRSSESLLEIDRGGLMRVESAAVGKRWIDARAIVDAVQEHHDTQSLEAVGQASKYIGRAIAQIVNALNPDLVVLGGIGGIGNLITDLARDEASKYALATAMRECFIVPSSMGDNAALVGAAMAARPNSTFDLAAARPNSTFDLAAE